MKTLKKLGVVWIAIIMLLASMNTVFANTPNLQVLTGAEVYIDGIQFQTKGDFYISKGITLVPMRELFEGLGAEVDWQAETQTIMASAKGREIELNMQHKTAKIIGQNQEIAVEAKTIDDITYVPLRFIAESFEYAVDWNNSDKIISIIDPQVVEESKTYASSSSFDKDFVKMEIIDNKKISVQGRTDLDKVGWLFKVEGIEESGASTSSIREFRKIATNNTYADIFELKNLKEGQYKITISYKEKSDSIYWSYYTGIILTCRDGEVFFSASPVCENNYVKSLSNSVVKPEKYLSIRIDNESERKEIEDLAREITKNASSNYEKLLKINNWVAQNIYYDWDAYRAGQYGRTDAYGTLQDKKSVCQGYAELTEALLRAEGIPARIISGHALGASANNKYWDGVDHTKTNHAWNEAYVDGRWVILDTTWNSRNKYEGGQFKEAEMSYTYFDPDLRTFSDTHKIMGR